MDWHKPNEPDHQVTNVQLITVIYLEFSKPMKSLDKIKIANDMQ